MSTEIIKKLISSYNSGPTNLYRSSIDKCNTKVLVTSFNDESTKRRILTIVVSL